MERAKETCIAWSSRIGLYRIQIGRRILKIYIFLQSRANRLLVFVLGPFPTA